MKRDMIHEFLNKKIMAAVAVAAFVFGLSSCTVEEEIDVPGQSGADGKVQLALHIDAGSYRMPVTRAGKAENDADSSTPYGGSNRSMPIVLVFELPSGEAYTGDAAAKAGILRTNAVFKEAALATDASAPKVKLGTTTRPVRLLIVSDPPSDLTVSALETALAGKTFAEAVTDILKTARLSTTNIVEEVPYAGTGKYIPATGIYDLDGGIDANTSIGASGAEVKLQRIAAKITVVNTAPKFILQGATVLNTRQYGYLYRDIDLPAAADEDKVHYLKGTGDTRVTGIAASSLEEAGKGNTNDNPLYVYESAAGEITVLVQGKIQYNDASYWYRLTLKDAKGPMTVDRNTHYTVTITEVGMRGYASIDDALTGTDVTGSVKYTVLSSGLSDHEIVDNGIYYLGLSNSEFIHWSSDTNNTEVLTTIRTNASEDTPISIEPIAGYCNDITTPTLGTPVKDSGETTIEVRTTFKPEFIFDKKMALYNIKVGVLEKQLLVVQRGTSLFIPGIPTKFEGKFVAANVEKGEEWLSFAMRDNGAYGSYTTNAVNSSEVGDAIQISSNVLQLQSLTTGTVSVDYGTIMASRTPTENYTITVTGGNEATFENTGGRVKISIAQQRNTVHRFAKSNVVLYVDKDNNQILTFAENEKDYETKTVKYLGGKKTITFTGTTALKANVEGIHFRWGGLVGISTDTNPGTYTQEGLYKDYYHNGYITRFETSDIVFWPIEYTSGLPADWYGIPYLDPNSIVHPHDDDMIFDAFDNKYGPKGYDAEAGKGDICRYISAKGWVEGDWRMPTGREFSNLGKETNEFLTGINYEIDFDDIEIGDKVELWEGWHYWDADWDSNYSGKRYFDPYVQKGVLFGNVKQFDSWDRREVNGMALHRFDWSIHRVTNPITEDNGKYYGFTGMKNARLIGAGVTAEDNANRNTPNYKGLTDPVGARVVVPASGAHDGTQITGALYYPGGNGYFMSASSNKTKPAVRALHVNAVKKLQRSNDKPMTYQPGLGVTSTEVNGVTYSFSVRCIRKLPDEL